MKYLLIDTANMFFRARHAAFRASDASEKIGYALHITLSSVNKTAQRFGADHVMFALEGRSWRKDVYARYKRNRTEARQAATEAQQEEDRLFWETFDELNKYLADSTNCSVIRHPNAEADDVIARWIDLHPEDQHVIVSSDTDFVQLLADNVTQYNGITDELITTAGVYDAKGRVVIDKRTKTAKTVPNPEWLLFEKCMRGDPTDNIFSAYPGVRTRGTKNRVGLTEAFEDRDRKGFAWNNLMLSRWVDADGEEHRVLDDYMRNRVLVDLRAQPSEIKQAVDQEIVSQVRAKTVAQVGAKFLRFCGRHELVRLSEQAEQYARWLNQPYQGVLADVESQTCHT